MIINDLDGYYIVFDTKNWNTELDTLYISLLTDFGFKQELREYEDSLKAYRDIKNSIDTAKEEGREEGRVEGIAKEKLTTAKRLLGMGLTQEQVAKGTDLSIEDIERLV